MLNIAILLILLVSAISVGFGLRYLLGKQYMPYHAQVSQMSWEALPIRLQALIRAMMKVIGGGMLALGIALAWLTLPLSKGEPWATGAILTLALVNGCINVHVTLSLRKVEPTAKTPVAAAASSLALVIIALILANMA